MLWKGYSYLSRIHTTCRYLSRPRFLRERPTTNAFVTMSDNARSLLREAHLARLARQKQRLGSQLPPTTAAASRDVSMRTLGTTDDDTISSNENETMYSWDRLDRGRTIRQVGKRKRDNEPCTSADQSAAQPEQQPPHERRKRKRVEELPRTPGSSSSTFNVKVATPLSDQDVIDLSNSPVLNDSIEIYDYNPTSVTAPTTSTISSSIPIPETRNTESEATVNIAKSKRTKSDGNDKNACDDNVAEDHEKTQSQRRIKEREWNDNSGGPLHLRIASWNIAAASASFFYPDGKRNV